MKFLPDHYVEDIRIYKPAITQLDVESDVFFADPFVRAGSPYGEQNDIRGGVIVAEGDAYVQEDRSNIYRRTLNIDVRGISFFNLFILVRSLDRELPMIDFGVLDSNERYYLWRMKEFPNVLARHTIVYARNFPMDSLQIYTTDEREGTRTSVSI